MAKRAQKVSYKDILKSCDADLKAGRVDAVVERLSRLKIVHVPREFRLRLSVICRRAGMAETGLRLLGRLVRSDKTIATVEERVEYAALLAQNGSVEEALGLLDSELPMACLVRGFCNVRLWNYESALADFEKFLTLRPTPYLEDVARVNLAAALVATARWERALEVIDVNLAKSLREGNARLVGNSLELRARVYLAQQKFDLCRADLEQAMTMSSPGSVDQLYALKWRSVLAAQESRSSAPLDELKLAAQKIENWETVREADLFACKVDFAQKRFDHLHFGSPLAGYRDRILREVDGEPSAVYFWGGEHAHALDLKTGQMHDGDEINAGKKIHQILSVLCRDFYAPVKLGQLFAQIYPGEYFDIFSSPTRVHSLIKRCRDWMHDSAISATIDSVGGGYALRIHDGFAIRIELETPKVDADSVFWLRLKSNIPEGQSFTVQTACRQLDIPKTTFLRLIKPMVRDGRLSILGSGRGTRYKIAG